MQTTFEKQKKAASIEAAFLVFVLPESIQANGLFFSFEFNFATQCRAFAQSAFFTDGHTGGTTLVGAFFESTILAIRNAIFRCDSGATKRGSRLHSALIALIALITLATSVGTYCITATAT